MRLIDTSTLTLRDFPFGNVPPYAILSHTWGAEEAKIQRFCDISRELGFDYGWVDTCCIDKSSSAELSEAINSMFQWYKSSAICIAYLNDVGPERPIDDVRHCRWISRGWTLQELIAPSEVEFYDSEWNHRGSRTTHSVLLSGITGIPENILVGSEKVQDCSVASRLSWASNRTTTRPKDIAYCLLGIFDVNMPLLYGEGPKAFRRLQETILHHNNDLTLFAWGRLTSHQVSHSASPMGYCASHVSSTKAVRMAPPIPANHRPPICIHRQGASQFRPDHPLRLPKAITALRDPAV
ncbi:hypothetical protein V8F33_010847 [Rhypophila sp. PSN 637]